MSRVLGELRRFHVGNHLMPAHFWKDVSISLPATMLVALGPVFLRTVSGGFAISVHVR